MNTTETRDLARDAVSALSESAAMAAALLYRLETDIEEARHAINELTKAPQ